MNKIRTSDWLRYVLAGIVVIGYFLLLIVLLYTPIKTTNSEILNIVMGALIGSFTTVIGYYFGSSSGSAEKTKLLNEKNEQVN